MKKLLTGLLVIGVILGSLSAKTVLAESGYVYGEAGFSDISWDYADYDNTLDTTTYFMLNGEVDEIPYELSLKYNNHLLNDKTNFAIVNLNNPNNTRSEDFKVLLTEGNNSQKLTAIVKVKCDNFTNIENTSAPKIATEVWTKNASNEEATQYGTFTTYLPAGYNSAQTLANFFIKWNYQEHLTAGRYKAIGRIDITIS